MPLETVVIPVKPDITYMNVFVYQNVQMEPMLLTSMVNVSLVMKPVILVLVNLHKIVSIVHPQDSYINLNVY